MYLRGVVDEAVLAVSFVRFVKVNHLFFRCGACHLDLLPHFLRHYEALGVQQMHAWGNMDAQSVVRYQTALSACKVPIRDYGNVVGHPWGTQDIFIKQVNAIQHGLPKDDLVVCVDVDEFLAISHLDDARAMLDKDLANCIMCKWVDRLSGEKGLLLDVGDSLFANMAYGSITPSLSAYYKTSVFRAGVLRVGFGYYDVATHTELPKYATQCLTLNHFRWIRGAFANYQQRFCTMGYEHNAAKMDVLFKNSEQINVYGHFYVGARMSTLWNGTPYTALSYMPAQMYDKNLLVIVPYRNRAQHLQLLLPYLNNYLLQRFAKYTLLVCEQLDDKPFNRGALFNAGVKIMGNGFSHVVLHDVDMLPAWLDSDSLYCQDRPTCCVNRMMFVKGRVKRTAPKFSGGVFTMSMKHFLAINGMSNEFWGWGFEDYDMRRRLIQKRIRPMRANGIFTMLYQDWGDSSNASQNRKLFIENHHKRQFGNGLEEVQYACPKGVELRTNHKYLGIVLQ